MSGNVAPSEGEVWLIDLDPTKGREQAGRRPGLIISVDEFNHGSAELVIVLPITSKDKRIPLHVAMEPPEGGLTVKSFIKCEDIRSVSKDRLMKLLGRVTPETLHSVKEVIKILINIF